MVLYVVNQYPNLSETFIAREIAGLRQYKIDVNVLAIRPSTHNDKNRQSPQSFLRRPIKGDRTAGECHPPILHTPSAFKPASFIAQVYFLCRKPLTYCSLCGQIALRESTSPLGICRGFVRFMKAVAIARQIAALKPSRIHAHFIHITADCAQVISTLLEIPYSVSAHAQDIYTQRGRTIRQRLNGTDFVIACTKTGANYLHRMIGRYSCTHEDEECENSRTASGQTSCKKNRKKAMQIGDIHVIHHGIPVSEFPKATPPHVPHITAIGRLVPKKGFDVLVEACAQLDRHNIIFKCTIVGGGPEHPQLQNMINAYGLNKKVHLVGPQTQETIRQLLQHTTIFALPSIITADGDRDGLPNVILEAMACGLPIVTTRASAANEAVTNKQNGILVRPESFDHFASALRHLIENPEYARQLGRAGLQRICQFDITQTIPPLAILITR